jgi:hypothetical protein
VAAYAAASIARRSMHTGITASRLAIADSLSVHDLTPRAAAAGAGRGIAEFPEHASLTIMAAMSAISRPDRHGLAAPPAPRHRVVETMPVWRASA